MERPTVRTSILRDAPESGRYRLRFLQRGTSTPDDANRPIDRKDARYVGIGANNGLKRTPGGNLGRNTERAPGLKNWDVDAIKNIHLTERFQLQFRAKFYNIFNTPRYGTVSVSPFAPSQLVQTVAANATASQPGLLLKETAMDGGGRVIHWQLRLHYLRAVEE